MTLEEYKKIVEKRLSKSRYIHCENVCKTAVALAKKYGADTKKAAVSGILHDITKELDVSEHMQICKKYNIKLDEIQKNEEKLLHAVTGAYLVKNELLIKDKDIFNAILHHTTGRADMSLLEKIIYLADYIEPRRDFEGVKELRKKAFENIDQALKLAFDISISEIKAKNKQIHTNTLQGREFLNN